MRKCEVCDGRLEGKRRDAVYCSAACKQYAHRKRKKTSTVPAEATLRVPVPAVITIRAPGSPRREQPEGPPAAPLVA